MDNKKIQKAVADQLFRLGIRSSTKGYYYYREGILIGIEGLRKNEISPHRKIYAKIGNMFNVSYDSISRALSYTLKRVWEYGNEKELKLVFGDNAKLPTPLGAIMTIANKLYEEERE